MSEKTTMGFFLPLLMPLSLLSLASAAPPKCLSEVLNTNARIEAAAYRQPHERTLGQYRGFLNHGDHLDSQPQDSVVIDAGGGLGLASLQLALQGTKFT